MFAPLSFSGIVVVWTRKTQTAGAIVKLPQAVKPDAAMGRLQHKRPHNMNARPQSHKSRSLPALLQLELTAPPAQDWQLSLAPISVSHQYPFSLRVSVELNAAILELIERSRLSRDELVCVQLNRIEEVYNLMKFLEEVKRFA